MVYPEYRPIVFVQLYLVESNNLMEDYVERLVVLQFVGIVILTISPPELWIYDNRTEGIKQRTIFELIQLEMQNERKG